MEDVREGMVTEKKITALLRTIGQPFVFNKGKGEKLG
jgi:hypothetical protein